VPIGTGTKIKTKVLSKYVRSWVDADELCMLGDWTSSPLIEKRATFSVA